MIEYDVRYYDSIGSTNDEALRLARLGTPHGTVVCAREQVAGRGRQGRQWLSPAGNLYVSILLWPDVPAGRAATLSFVTALAVADTVDACLPADVRATLKWPNDVLVRGAKIAGILLEHADAAVVVGIGLNVEHAPVGTAYPVTCLREWGVAGAPTPALPREAGEGEERPLSRMAGEGWGGGAALHTLLDAFSRRLAEWQDRGFAATRTAWLVRAHPPGTTLRVTLGDRTIYGRFTDLAEDGALILDTTEGRKRIVAGEVSSLPRHHCQCGSEG